jgi:hypothetical protein
MNPPDRAIATIADKDHATTADRTVSTKARTVTGTRTGIGRSINNNNTNEINNNVGAVEAAPLSRMEPRGTTTELTTTPAEDTPIVATTTLPTESLPTVTPTDGSFSLHTDLTQSSSSDANLPHLSQLWPQLSHAETIWVFHQAAGAGAWKVCEFALYQDLSLLYAVHNLKQGRTALHWAARNGQINVCQRLVGPPYSMSVDVTAVGDVTPLQLAVWQGQLETCRVLVTQCGADPNYVNRWGCSTAHWLAKCPHSDSSPDVVQAMCHWLFYECHVTSFNTPNTHGQTPLHKAAYAGNYVVLQYLVHTLGVLDDIRDHQGHLAADCALRSNTSNSKEIAMWIRRHSSPLIGKACQVLKFSMTNINGLSSGNEAVRVPDLMTLRRRYRQLARLYHPDRAPVTSLSSIASSCTETTIMSPDNNDWYQITSAYQLLVAWWVAPDVYDAAVQLATLNTQLCQMPAILWTLEWHLAKEHQEKQHGNVHSHESIVVIQQFEDFLVRLLQTPAHLHKGLALAQLPKEYAKNFASHVVPDPKAHGYRNLHQLLQKACPRVEVRNNMRAYYSPNY